MCMQADRMSGNTRTLQLRNILPLTSPEPGVNRRECKVAINTEAKEITRPAGAEESTHMCRQVWLVLELFGLFAVCAVAVCMNPAQAYKQPPQQWRGGVEAGVRAEAEARDTVKVLKQQQKKKTFLSGSQLKAQSVI